MTDRSLEWTTLAASASSLSDAKFLKIVELFERIRQEPGVCGAMTMFRRRMAALRPPRRISASRLFFLPVEDLLDDVLHYRRKLSRVSRGTIDICWRIVDKHCGERRIRRIAKSLETTDAHDWHALQRVGEELWLEGAKGLNIALDLAYDNPKDRVALFGRDDDVLRQIAIIATVSEIGATVQEAKSQLPDRPVEVLADYHIEVLRTAIKGLAALDMRHVTPFLLVLSARMLRPGDLLSVLAETRIDGQQQAKDEVAREVGVAALENLLRQSGDMTTAIKDGMIARDIATLAERLLDGFDSMNSTLQHPDQKGMVRRVDQARTIISNALLSRVIEPADAELLGHVSNLLEKQANPFFADAPTLPTPEETAKAEEFARAFRRCSRIAPMVGLKPQMQEKTLQICNAVRQVSDTLGNAADPQRRGASVKAEVADEHMVSLLRLVEIVAGPDEAEKILADWMDRIGELPNPVPQMGWNLSR